MREVLFLSHRIPFPPDRGDKIRSHHILKAIAKLAPVHVATFSDDHEDALHEADLASTSASYCLIPRKKPLLVAGGESLARRCAVSVAAFHSIRLKQYVRKILSEHPIDVIYVFSGQMAQYIPKEYTGRVVVDLVDVDSLKFEQYAAKSHGVRRWIESREGRLLRAEEALIADRADHTILISELEAEQFRKRTPHIGERLKVIGNGLDAAFFDPSSVAPEPRMLSCFGPRIIFTGQMDYPPNQEAVFRAIERILPAIRKVHPEVSFHVVGRNPSQALLNQSGKGGVTIWGRVDDIRPWLAGSDIALIPLELARGIQNKVLESMAMNLPVVCSIGAIQGIDITWGKECLVAETDDQMIKALLALISNQATRVQMGARAREWILRHATWEGSLRSLPAILGSSSGLLTHAI